MERSTLKRAVERDTTHGGQTHGTFSNGLADYVSREHSKTNSLVALDLPRGFVSFAWCAQENRQESASTVCVPGVSGFPLQKLQLTGGFGFR